MTYSQRVCISAGILLEAYSQVDMAEGWGTYCLIVPTAMSMLTRPGPVCHVFLCFPVEHAPRPISHAAHACESASAGPRSMASWRLLYIATALGDGLFASTLLRGGGGLPCFYGPVWAQLREIGSLRLNNPLQCSRRRSSCLQGFNECSPLLAEFLVS